MLTGLLKEPLTNFYFIRHIQRLGGDQPGQQPSSAGPRKPYSLQKKDLPPQLVRCLRTTLGTSSPGHIRWRDLASTWHLHESRGTRSLWVLRFLPLFLAWNLSLLAGSLAFLIASWRFLKSTNNSDWLRLFSSSVQWTAKRVTRPKSLGSRIFGLNEPFPF